MKIPSVLLNPPDRRSKDSVVKIGDLQVSFLGRFVDRFNTGEWRIRSGTTQKERPDAE